MKKRKRLFRQSLAILMMCMLMAGALPAAVFAAENGGTGQTGTAAAGEEYEAVGETAMDASAEEEYETVGDTAIDASAEEEEIPVESETLEEEMEEQESEEGLTAGEADQAVEEDTPGNEEEENSEEAEQGLSYEDNSESITPENYEEDNEFGEAETDSLDIIEKQEETVPSFPGDDLPVHEDEGVDYTTVLEEAPESEEVDEDVMNGAVNTQTVSLNGEWSSSTLFEEGDYLFFDFIVPSDGKVTITAQSFRGETEFNLKNDDQTVSYGKYKIYNGNSTTPDTRTEGFWLKGGETYHLIACDSKDFGFAGTGKVRIKLDFESAGATDQEPNNDFSKAMVLEKGRIAKGAILDVDDRVDFFKINVQKDSDFVIRVTSCSSNMACGVYDASYTQVLFEKVPDGTKESPKVKEYTIEKPDNNTYYIKIGDYYAPGTTWQNVYPARGAYSIQWTQSCAHTYDSGKTEKAASGNDGLLVYTCMKCGNTKNQVIPAISDVTLSKTTYAYDGKEKKPGITVKDRNGDKISTSYYTVKYAPGRKNIGTYKVTVTFRGRYKGEISKAFTIKKANQSITVKSTANSIAVGKTATVSITGNKGKKSFKSSNTTVATVTSAGKVTAKKVGIVKITAASAATDYYNAASKTVTIKIVPPATSRITATNQATGIKITWKKVVGANGYLVYRGSTLVKRITSGSTVTFTDTKASSNGTKYTFKVIPTASSGNGAAKSIGIFRLARPVISSASNSASKKATIKWGRNAKATGYQIQYSTSKTFASGNKTVTLSGSTIVSRTLTGLVKGRTYYVRMRTYRTVGSSKYYSVWSTIKSVKIKK